jgi:hypothetical protein
MCLATLWAIFRETHLVTLIPNHFPLIATARQGCQIFLGPKYQNGEKYTRFTTKYTKWP